MINDLHSTMLHHKHDLSEMTFVVFDQWFLMSPPLMIYIDEMILLVPIFLDIL